MVALAAAVALTAPAGAAAGGFATVGVDPLPDGIGAGKTWHVRLTILQHGRTPLDGVEPRVIATRGSVRRVFAARPAGRPGVYRAAVVFPTRGIWHYVVDDGFTMTHTFPPVRVRAAGGDKGVSAPAAGGAKAPSTPAGGGPADSGGGPGIPLVLALAALAGVLAALGIAAVRRAPSPSR
jgi:hypothetical protein